MRIQNRLIKDTTLYAVGPMLNKCIALLLVPYYSYVLAKDEFGYYDLVLTGSQLIIAIVTLKISDGLYRWLTMERPDKQKQIRAISCSFLIISGGILLILLINAFVPHAAFPFKNLVCGYVISGMALAHFYQLLRGLGMIKSYSFLSVITGGSFLLLNIIFLGVMHLQLQGVILALLLSNVAGVIYAVFRVRLPEYLRLREVNLNTIKEMVRYSAPLVYNAVSWWLMGGFDRYIIAIFLGLAANGIYAVSVKYCSVIILVNSFFIPAWQDLLLKNVAAFQVKTHVAKMFNHYGCILFSAVILLSAFSRLLLGLLIDVRYIDSWKYIPLLLSGAGLLSMTSFLGTLFVLEKKTVHIFKTSLAGSILNVLVTLLLIRPLGLYAPALGIVSGFLVILLIRYGYYKKKMELKINDRRLWFLLGTFIFTLFGLYASSLLFYYSSLLISVIAILIINRNLGKELAIVFRSIFSRLRKATG